MGRRRKKGPSAVGGLGNPVAEFHVSLRSPEMRGVPIGAHPARRSLGERMTRMATFVHELETKRRGGVHGKMGLSWESYNEMKDRDPHAAAMYLMDVMQTFAGAPLKAIHELRKSGIHEFTTKSDFPAEVRDTIEKYHVGLEEIDTHWRDIFDVIDFTGTTKSGFKIRDITSGLTFRKVPVGDTVTVYGMSGTEVEITFDRFGGALGWDKQWFDDEEYWTVDDTALEFRRKYYKDQAQVFYALLEALIGVNDINWQTHPDGVASGVVGYQAGRDAATINAAITQIIDDLKDQDMDVSPNETFILLAPNALRDRLNRALAARYTMPSGPSTVEVSSNVDARYTAQMTTTTRYAVILPKRKLKAGVRMDLTVLTDTDILAYAEVSAGWGRYGGGIGENNQIEWCKTSG